MALNKVNYIDNETIITAENLNNIQDEIIANTNANPYIGYVDNIFDVNENCICKYDSQTLNSPYTAGLTAAADGICIVSIIGDFASYICYPTSDISIFVAVKNSNGYSKWYNQDLERNYPVGSIYLSVSSNSPAALFGGTWEQIMDRFLLGAGKSYTLGATGGQAAYSLNENHLPQGTITFIMGYSGDWSVGQWSNHGQSDNWIARPKSQQSGYSQQQLNNMPPYLAVYIWKRVS